MNSRYSLLLFIMIAPVVLIGFARDTDASTIRSWPDSSVVALWADSLAAIPDGWQPVDALADRFIRGADEVEVPGTSGGGPHGHNGGEMDLWTELSTQSFLVPQYYDIPSSHDGNEESHDHQLSIDFGSSTLADALPAHVRLTPLATGQLDEIPQGLIAMWSGSASSIPPNWILCDGGDGRPDLRDRFVRGATPGEEPGSPVGSTRTHAHSLEPEPWNIHMEPAPSVQVENGYANYAFFVHTHDLDIPAFDTHEETADMPPFHELAFIRFEDSSPAPPPEGLILMWTGSTTALPTGWTLCDGSEGTPDLRSRFIRSTTSGEDPGALGGGEAHSHTAGPLSITTGTASHTVYLGGFPHDPPFVAPGTHTHELNIPAFSTQVNRPDFTGDSIL